MTIAADSWTTCLPAASRIRIRHFSSFSLASARSLPPSPCSTGWAGSAGRLASLPAGRGRTSWSAMVARREASMHASAAHVRPGVGPRPAPKDHPTLSISPPLRPPTSSVPPDTASTLRPFSEAPACNICLRRKRVSSRAPHGYFEIPRPHCGACTLSVANLGRPAVFISPPSPFPAYHSLLFAVFLCTRQIIEWRS